jgi:hypothetical protein
MTPRCIFLSVYDGDTEKNVLRSGTFERLKQSGNRIVLLIRNQDLVDYYREQFADERVLVDVLPPAFTWGERLWYFIGWNSLPTRAAKLRRHMYRIKGSPVYLRMVGATLGVLGRFRIWREFLRLVYWVTPDAYASDLFSRYAPDLVFAPGMFSPEDTRLLKAAKKRGITTVATAKSWDVLTTKAFTRVKADRLLVFNEINRDEAVSIGDYSADAVTITGFPQFDAYAREDLKVDRTAFMEAYGLDPEREFVFFSVPGDWKTAYTKDILEYLSRRIEAGAFAKPLQILAQIHPKYPSSCEGLILPHVVIRRAGTFNSASSEKSIDVGVSQAFVFSFTSKDIQQLYNAMYHSVVTVNVESTLTLDAAALDRPSILINYDGDHPQPYWQSINRLYEREHYQHVLATGGAPLVTSHEELFQEIDALLKNPDHRKANLRLLQEKMLYRKDGKACERVSSAILEYLA